MSIKLQKQIDQLRLDRDADRETIRMLVSFKEWAIKEMQNGMLDVLERVIKQKLEIDVVEKSTDQKLAKAFSLIDAEKDAWEESHVNQWGPLWPQMN